MIYNKVISGKYKYFSVHQRTAFMSLLIFTHCSFNWFVEKVSIFACYNICWIVYDTCFRHPLLKKTMDFWWLAANTMPTTGLWHMKLANMLTHVQAFIWNMPEHGLGGMIMMTSRYGSTSHNLVLCETTRLQIRLTSLTSSCQAFLLMKSVPTWLNGQPTESTTIGTDSQTLSCGI